MLYKLSALDGFTLSASDGEIGSVEDFYFDDEAWAIRYLAIDTGNWLSGRKVLISPPSLGEIAWEREAIGVNLTKEQIESSPPIERHQPLSRQYETQFYDHYQYPYYWEGPYLWGPVRYPGGLVTPSEPITTNSEAKELRAIRERQRMEDQHLRSVHEVTSYRIEASDGGIGHIEDFIVENANWAIRYVAVDTRNWWPGKKVLLSPQWIRSVDWNESKAYVELPREKIKRAPEYNDQSPITREYEERVHQYYGRPGYW